MEYKVIGVSLPIEEKSFTNEKFAKGYIRGYLDGLTFYNNNYLNYKNLYWTSQVDERDKKTYLFRGFSYEENCHVTLAKAWPIY